MAVDDNQKYIVLRVTNKKAQDAPIKALKHPHVEDPRTSTFCCFLSLDKKSLSTHYVDITEIDHFTGWQAELIYEMAKGGPLITVACGLHFGGFRNSQECH